MKRTDSEIEICLFELDDRLDGAGREEKLKYIMACCGISFLTM